MLDPQFFPRDSLPQDEPNSPGEALQALSKGTLASGTGPRVAADRPTRLFHRVQIVPSRAVRADDALLQHLASSDAVMAGLIAAAGPLSVEARQRGRPADAYGALLRSIVGQQLSTKAAHSIYGRFLELFGGSTPTPQQLLDADPEAIRAVGFSNAKVRYVRSLAEHVLSGELGLDHLHELGDEEVMRELTAVKGLGEWTAHMFLIFHLGRPDVLPVGDLGIRRAVERAYGLEELPSREELDRLGERWAPYRTLASLYLWESLDNTPT
jgi:DNA-3-methyladenine glycosylase II